MNVEVTNVNIYINFKTNILCYLHNHETQVCKLNSSMGISKNEIKQYSDKDS